jgi:hypothetical protein
VVCLGATGLRLGMPLDDTRLLLGHVLQQLRARLYMVSLSLPAVLDRVLLQQLCLRLCRL